MSGGDIAGLVAAGVFAILVALLANVSDASANVSALSSLVTSTVGQPLIKVASFSYGVRQAFRGKKPGDDDRAAGTSQGGEQ